MSIDAQPIPAYSPLVPPPAPLPPSCRFLGKDATHVQLIQATAANHAASWTGAGDNREVYRQEGVTWTFTPSDRSITVAFPRIPAAAAGAALDSLVAEWRSREPRTIACWSLEPAHPRDLGARLCARGFEWGWKPHWMALNLDKMCADLPIPAGLQIAVVEDDPDWDVDDLPYYSRPSAPAATSARPRRSWRFGAWHAGQIVGQSNLFVTTGRQGVAGLYGIGVVPAARRQGVGRAVTLAACQFARALGCRWATLNSATDIYERLGFVSLGWGQTWFMHASTLAAPPPPPAQVAFAEAVGRSNVNALDALVALPKDLDAPLSNGMTPLELAVNTNQPASADWLVTHGATLDVLSAWDLGWHDRIGKLLAQSPHLANRCSGDGQTTPLHQAVVRGDTSLLRLLLTAGPDLTIEDAQFHATALGWAHHFGRTEMIPMIEQQTKS